MLQTARAQDWDTLNEQAGQRQGLLDQAFSGVHSEASAQETKALILRILEIDKLIIVLSQETQQLMLGKLTGFGRGRKAKQAYAAHSLSP